MSWEEMGTVELCSCPCGRGRVTRVDRDDDWGRFERKYYLECPDCSDKYEIEYETTGWQHPGHERTSVYLAPKDYPPYDGPSEDVAFGKKQEWTKDFVVWLIENETRANLAQAKAELVECGSCSRVKGVAAYIVEHRRKLLKSARVKVIVSEIDCALERYDTFNGNAEQREPVRAAEQIERAKYREKRRGVLIRVD